MSDIAIQNAATTQSQSGLPPGTNFIVTGGDDGAGKPAVQTPGQQQPKQEEQKVTPGIKLDDKADPVVPDADTANEFTYDPTGDSSLDYALNFVGKLGYGDTHPAIIAAKGGDFNLLRVELATRGVQGADAVVKLAEDAHARFAKDAAAKDAALGDYAAKAAGSAENWGLVRSWAAANATPEEKAQVNAALSAGGLVAQGVIGQLVSLYQAKHTLPKDAASAAKNGAGASSTAAGEPMTAKAYSDGVNELYRKYGDRATETTEYAALQGQRLAARRAGY